MACLIANVGLGFWLMHPLAHVGLALAVSLSSLLNFGLLYVLLARKRKSRLIPAISTLKTAILSILIGAGAYFTASLHPWWLLLIPAWVIAYISLAYLLRMNEARLFVDMFIARMQRRKAARQGK